MKIIEKIRTKSEKTRQFLSLVLAGALTLFIVIIWLSFGGNKDESLVVVEEKEASKLSSISPVQVIKEEFSRAFNTFKENTEIVSTSTNE